MGRKHNDVFLLGPEPLHFEDLESRDERMAEPEETELEGERAHRASPAQRGLGHRPLSRRPAASRPNPAARLIGRQEPRRPGLRASAALAAGAGIAIAAARLLSAGGDSPAEQAPTSSAAQIAQVEPTPPAARRQPIAAPPRPHPGAGPPRGPEHHPTTPARSQSTQEAPPRPVAVEVAPAAVPPPIYPSADAFGFER